VAWSLCPQRTNEKWWATYRNAAAVTDPERKDFEAWMRSLPLPKGFHAATTPPPRIQGSQPQL
jgi:hypothetical protein